MKISLFLPLLFLLIISCDSNSGSDSDKVAIATYELAIVDSIEVDFMEEIHLLDYDPEREIFLGYNRRSGDYLEFDMLGEILSQVNLLGDGPNDHGGAGSFQVNYLGEGKIGVANSSKYYIYDKDWKLIETIDYQPMENAILISAGGSMAYLTNSRPQSKLARTTTTIMGSAYFVMQKEHHKNPFLFSLNWQTGEVSPYHILPDSSLYLTSNTFYPSLADAIISYNYERNVLEIIHEIEPVIYTYDIESNPPKLLSAKAFDYTNPNPLIGVSYTAPMEQLLGNTLYESLNQLFTGLYSFEDMQLIQFRERKAGAELIGPNESNQDKLNEFQSSDANTWAYLIQDGKRVSQNIPMNDPMIALQLGKGKFLSANYVDPDIERDTQLFYIYDLREVGK